MPRAVPRDSISEEERHAIHEWLRGDQPVEGRFLNDLRRWARTHAQLTPNQLIYAAADYRRFVVGDSAAAEATLPQAALWNQVTHIRNGVYTISRNGQHRTYQIYTPIRGGLREQRIIKLKNVNGQFKGFGFIDIDGGLRLWRSHLSDSDHEYVAWARTLLGILNEHPITDITEAMEVSGWLISAAQVCRRCNRQLTTPDSIASGIGPECARRTTSSTERGAGEVQDEDVNRILHEASNAAREAERAAARAVQLPFSELGTGEVL